MDIQAAIAQRAGVGRYAKHLAEHLAPLAGDDELSLFYFDFKHNGIPFAAPGATQCAVRWIPGRIVQAAWKRLGVPPFDRFAGAADVYHFPNFIRPPLSRGKSVVTIHDLAFLRHPETIEEKNYGYLTRCIERTVERADALIAVSEFTAREIHDLLGVPRERIATIHEGLEESWRAPDAETVRAVRRRLGLDRPYLLTVGTLEPRKNIPFLVEVFERLDSFDGDLVLAGMKGWKVEPILERIRASKRARNIRRLDYVAEADLPALYAGAELFVFASLYEGFGFTPLEAMACGTPTVAARAGSLPEVLGDAALMPEAFDPDAWAAAIDSLLGDESARASQSARGLERARAFRWPPAAAQTWALYRRL